MRSFPRSPQSTRLTWILDTSFLQLGWKNIPKGSLLRIVVTRGVNGGFHVPGDNYRSYYRGGPQEWSERTMRLLQACDNHYSIRHIRKFRYSILQTRSGVTTIIRQPAFFNLCESSSRHERINFPMVHGAATFVCFCR